MPPKPTSERPSRGSWTTGPAEAGHYEYADPAVDAPAAACRFRNISSVRCRKQAAFQPERPLHLLLACPPPRLSEVTSYASVMNGGLSRSPPCTVTSRFSRSSAATERIAAAGHDTSSHSNQSNGCRSSTHHEWYRTDAGDKWRAGYWPGRYRRTIRCWRRRTPTLRSTRTSSNPRSRCATEQLHES